MLEVTQLNGFTGNDGIITSNLIYHYDVGNTGSYPGTGTTLTNLSGTGNNGTLTNGPTFSSSDGGSLVFDGTDDNVVCTGSTTFTEATFLSWNYRNGTQSSFAGLVHSRASTNGGTNFYSNQHTLNYHWSTSPDNPPGWNSGVAIPNLAWSMCVASVKSSSAIVYVCSSTGISTNSNAFSHPSITLNAFKLGLDTGFPRYFKGNMAIALVYNRALTTAEIEQTFSVTRKRFGV